MYSDIKSFSYWDYRTILHDLSRCELFDNYIDSILERFTIGHNIQYLDILGKLILLLKLRVINIGNDISIKIGDNTMTLYSNILIERLENIQLKINEYDNENDMFVFCLPHSFDYTVDNKLDLYTNCLAGIRHDCEYYDLRSEDEDAKTKILSLLETTHNIYREGDNYFRMVTQHCKEYPLFVTPDGTSANLEILSTFPRTLAELAIGKGSDVKYFLDLEYILLNKMHLGVDYLKAISFNDAKYLIEKYSKEEREQREAIEKAQREAKSKARR